MMKQRLFPFGNNNFLQLFLALCKRKTTLKQQGNNEETTKKQRGNKCLIKGVYQRTRMQTLVSLLLPS